MNYEIRHRDPNETPLAYEVREGAELADVLGLASQTGTVDVYADGAYLVSYCGRGPYWWPEDDGGMHQVGSHGWCHDCHRSGLGYVHHLDYATEVQVLAVEYADDQVARERCEADGLTPLEYAVTLAGRAVPAHGDYSFAVGIRELGVNAAGLAAFAVDMWDMTTWLVAVELAEGAPDTALRLAEERAHAAAPKRCYDCHGATGHSKRCHVTRDREFYEKYPEIAAKMSKIRAEREAAS